MLDRRVDGSAVHAFNHRMRGPNVPFTDHASVERVDGKPVVDATGINYPYNTSGLRIFVGFPAAKFTIFSNAVLKYIS